MDRENLINTLRHVAFEDGRSIERRQAELIAYFIISHTSELRKEIDELKQSLCINKGVANITLDMLDNKNREIARLTALVDSVEKPLGIASEVLTNPDWGTWEYMEGSDVYQDIRKGADATKEALQKIAEFRGTK